MDDHMRDLVDFCLAGLQEKAAQATDPTGWAHVLREIEADRRLLRQYEKATVYRGNTATPRPAKSPGSSTPSDAASPYALTTPTTERSGNRPTMTWCGLRHGAGRVGRSNDQRGYGDGRAAETAGSPILDARTLHRS
jgi:hypothetical protein